MIKFKKVDFTKMEGAGNDFILIDNRKGNIPLLSKKIKKNLCSRKKGIGADGILILESDSEFPFKMRYFNADGGEAEMCGNGARCVSLYAFSKGIVRRKFTFRSKSGIHRVEILRNNSVKVELPRCEFKKRIRLTIEGKPCNCDYLFVGVPHIVIFTEEIKTINVIKIGKRIRNLKRFSPEGTNVNFVRNEGNSRLTIRTYERGVENETLACGTGIAAVSAVAYEKDMVSSPVYVRAASHEILTVFLEKANGNLIPYLLGKAHIVFSGTVGVL